MSEVRDGFHGTKKTLVNKKVLNDYFQIKKYDVIQEATNASNHKNSKNPGSLGYGVYFFSRFEMAKEFISKFSGDDIILQADLDLENCIDLDDEDFQNIYHIYRKKVERTAQVHFKNFNVRSNAKQNVYDGIVIELYIRELKKKQVEVSSVKKRTYTPSKDEKIEFYSNVPNGTEYCIRLSEIITNTKEIVGWILWIRNLY